MIGVPGATGRPVAGSINPTTVGVSLLGSVSLDSSAVDAGSPASAVAKSSLASGASLAFGSGSVVTVKVTSAVSVAPLGSSIVYSKTGSPM